MKETQIEVSSEKYKKILQYEKFDYALSCLSKASQALQAIGFGDLCQVIGDIKSAVREEMPDDPEEENEE